MAQPVMQHSFHAGEWAPALNARVDLQKYHAGAALLRNFFVDYRGGASSRAGTEYIIQCAKSDTAVRLIPFQASFTVSYVLEFGDQYIRFINNGVPVTETAFNIVFATVANPGQITVTGHNFQAGDVIFIININGTSQLNNRYFVVGAVSGPNITLADLNGAPFSTLGFGAYVNNGLVSRVYKIPSPYLASELALLKFAQNVNTLVICHPAHPPYVLTLNMAANWTLLPINFGTTVATPGGMAIATTAAGIVNWAYSVTAVDANGQESAVSAVQSSTVSNAVTPNTVTISVSWAAVSGALSYNVYRAGPSTAVAGVPTGAAFGFVSNVTGIRYDDVFNSAIPISPADYTERIPLTRNPFQGAGVTFATVTASGSPLALPGTVPSVTFAAPPSGGVTATGAAVAGVTGVISFATFATFGTPYSVGQIIGGPAGSRFVVATVGPIGDTVTYTSLQPMTFPGSNPGALASGLSIPANPSPMDGGATVNLTWGIVGVNVTNSGAGYAAPPAITFSSSAAAATASLGTASRGNPTVPIYFDQRLWLMGPPGSPQQFNASQPGAYYNFNTNDPILPDDAIEGVIVSGKLNTIKSALGMPTGLILLADQQAWLINGGAKGSTPTAVDINAEQQAYNGASDVPPILANFDILYVQAKGSIVRDLTFNFYTNIFTGNDISVLSSHLFYGYTIKEWAWAEEPFKIVWAVRSDGVLLSLTFLKEQELIGWAHSDTQGMFKSTCAITEQVSFGSVDAAYFVVERVVNGLTVKYIERMAERFFPNGAEDAWTVDAGIGTAPLLENYPLTLTLTGTTLTSSGPLFSPPTANIGQVIRFFGGSMTITAEASSTSVTVSIQKAPTQNVAPPGTWSVWASVTTISGAEHLAGKVVTGLADGVVIPPFTMPATGIFTLAAPAVKVVVGLAYTPQLRTLALDLGEPTAQGKRKKITGVTLRCENTLGLSIGKSATTLVPMKDLIVGNLGTMTNAVVTNLVTGDARTNIDPTWDVPGQYFIQQSNPLPATILGVIPEIVVGDTK